MKLHIYYVILYKVPQAIVNSHSNSTLLIAGILQYKKLRFYFLIKIPFEAFTELDKTPPPRPLIFLNEES